MDHKIRLLIVDDEVRYLKTLAARLELRDFDVTTADNGKRALELAKEKTFDLALLDLKMPGLSGEELLEILKRDHPLLEVIILTGHGSLDSAVQCTQAGSYQYLAKPCETDQLLSVLTKAYKTRIQRKMEVDDKRLEELMSTVQGESPLGILRRLREFEHSS